MGVMVSHLQGQGAAANDLIVLVAQPRVVSDREEHRLAQVGHRPEAEGLPPLRKQLFPLPSHEQGPQTGIHTYIHQ